MRSIAIKKTANIVVTNRMEVVMESLSLANLAKGRIPPSSRYQINNCGSKLSFTSNLENLRIMAMTGLLAFPEDFVVVDLGDVFKANLNELTRFLYCLSHFHMEFIVSLIECTFKIDVEHG